MQLDPLELSAAIEAVVFVSSEPVTVKVLLELFPHETEETLRAGLEQLAATFEQQGRGLLLDRVAGGWRIATRPEVHPHVARFVQRERSERLSIRTLETLSIIAYKQPVTAAEVGEIRGVDATGTVKTLLDRGLIRIAGRKKVVGRPFVYGTTRTFLTSFGLDDLSELPTLKELEEFVTDVPTTRPDEVDAVEVEPEAGDNADEGDAPSETAPESAIEGEARQAATATADGGSGGSGGAGAPVGRRGRGRRGSGAD